MRCLTFIPESHRTRVLLAPQTTAVGEASYVAPTPGVQKITIRAIVSMGNAAPLALTLNSADDAVGTNPVAFADIPVFVGGVRQTDAHLYTIDADTGNFIVDFCITPELIPQGKTLGLSYAISNAANLISAEIIEETVYAPTAS
ncbi:hypothetical protein [Clostridium akagii]|uniref:hypothetical protein n=1 Tax=Clostridium akagii TaxID=91623 RepID=UPI00047D337C|nr:hypothetical protein [Clostridium akagii]